MKEDFSISAKKEFSFWKIPLRYFYHNFFIRKFIILFRKISLLKYKSDRFNLSENDEDLNYVLNLENFSSKKEDFLSKGYTYGKDLLCDSYLIRLLSNWPPIFFLNLT